MILENYYKGFSMLKRMREAALNKHKEKNNKNDNAYFFQTHTLKNKPYLYQTRKVVRCSHGICNLVTKSPKEVFLCA